jgi:hypothetical protein
MWHTKVSWIPGEFDSLLERAAYGKAGPICIQSKCAAFCPYDGGMDVFIKEERALRAVRGLFRAWAPQPESGV